VTNTFTYAQVLDLILIAKGDGWEAGYIAGVQAENEWQVRGHLVVSVNPYRQEDLDG
jgi:hypothetical protein